MLQTRKQLLMNAYFTSHFGYYPLVWMNQSRTLNNCISRLHKTDLGLVYNNLPSIFTELFKKDKLVTIHHRNLQVLALKLKSTDLN